MGRIRLYDRQKLASAAVGTPGVTDTGDELIRMSNRQAELTAQQIKIDAAKIEIADNLEAEKYRINFENEYYKKIEQIKQDNMSDPFAVPNKAFDDGNTLVSDMAQQIQNPRVQEKFKAKAQESIKTYEGKIRTWASRTVTENAYVNLADSMQALETQGGLVASPTDLTGLVSSAEKLALNSATAIGVEKANKLFEQTRKGIYENYAYSALDKDPAVVKTMVDKGVFNGILDEKEQLSLKRSADSLIRKRENEIKIGNRVGHIDTISALYDKEANGSLTLKEVDDAIAAFKRTGAGITDLRSLYAIRRSLLGGDTSGGSGGSKGGKGRASYQNQAETLVSITDEYLKIFDKVGASGKIMETPSTYITLGDLSNLQNKIITAVSQKRLDKSTGNAMLKGISAGKAMLAGTSRSVTSDVGLRAGLAQGRIGGKTTKQVPIAVYNQAMRTINTWADRNIPDAKLRNEFKYEALTSFSMQYDEAKGAKGFNMNAYTNQIIAHYARKYGKSVQLKKVK